MRGRMFITMAGTLGFVLGVVILSETITAQKEGPESARKSRDTGQPTYFPYPPGIVPTDVTSEIARIPRV